MGRKDLSKGSASICLIRRGTGGLMKLEASSRLPGSGIIAIERAKLPQGTRNPSHCLFRDCDSHAVRHLSPGNSVWD